METTAFCSMKRFKCGLVVGKFSPLHLGHEHVIRRAAAECEQVVILSYSKPEFPGCEADVRETWLRTRFPSAQVLVVSDERLQRWPEVQRRWPSIPENEAPAEVHRAFSADLCSSVMGVKVDALYSSENYGLVFAEFLTNYYRTQCPTEPESTAVTAVTVDRARSEFPISGTLLRKDTAELRKWTAPEVYASFVRRICILGGESSGKSTLARALAEQFRTLFVAEYGRELWEKEGGQLEYEDLLAIGKEQVAREDAFARRSEHFLFCDTSPLTTLFYSLEMFGKAAPELFELSRRRYHATILCLPDFPFAQDGTRRDAVFRELQHAWYLQQLSAQGIRYVEAAGSMNERIETIAALLRAT